MRDYWKQALWIGGIYWVFSLPLHYGKVFELQLVDAGFSALLLLFLIPFRWLAPMTKIDDVMRKMPIVSTFLVAGGWMPYWSGLTFFVSLVMTCAIWAFSDFADYRIYQLFSTLYLIDYLRTLVLVVALMAASVSVLVFKKSIVGCLGKGFQLTDGDACERQNAGAPAEASAKDMYFCKAEAKRRKAASATKKTTVKTNSVAQPKAEKGAAKKAPKKTKSKKSA